MFQEKYELRRGLILTSFDQQIEHAHIDKSWQDFHIQGCQDTQND